MICDVLEIDGVGVLDELLDGAATTKFAGSRWPQSAFSLALQAACALASPALLDMHCV